MTPETFLQRLRDRDLWLGISPETGKLAIYGDPARLTDGICEYIQHNREQLLAILQGQSEVAVPDPIAIDDMPSEPRTLTCYACPNQVIEHDESTWRMSPDGTLFCLPCWDAKNLGILRDGDIADLEAATQCFTQGAGCVACGGHDWIVDPWIPLFEHRRTHGFLVCPCLLAKREENQRLDQALAEAEQERKQRLGMSATKRTRARAA